MAEINLPSKLLPDCFSALNSSTPLSYRLGLSGEQMRATVKHTNTDVWLNMEAGLKHNLHANQPVWERMALSSDWTLAFWCVCSPRLITLRFLTGSAG